MTYREVWIVAGDIMAEYGDQTTDYIIDRVTDALGDRVAVDDWRRIASAVDVIAAGGPRC